MPLKKFSTSLYGYNKQEVTDFVSNVIKEYEDILNQLKDKDKEINSLQESLIKYQNMEATLNKAIMIAEDTSNQIKRIARDEGKSIVDAAKRDASRIVNEALAKTEDIERDAEDLQRRVNLFKRKFRQAIEAELEFIDDLDDKY